MLTFLFWNIQKKPLLNRLARLTAGHCVDVLILAECEPESANVLTALNQSPGVSWHYPLPEEPKLRVFTRLPQGSIRELFNHSSGRMTICEIQLTSSPPILLAAVH